MQPKYNKNLKSLARKLRKESTKGEIILWSEVLRAKKMLGYQFNRQYPMKIPPSQTGAGELNIIVDFICRKLKLIIELDGYSHNFKHQQDKIRDEKLSKYGYSILRFEEKEVKYDINNVIREIELKIRELEEKSPRPPFSKGEKE